MPEEFTAPELIRRDRVGMLDPAHAERALVHAGSSAVAGTTTATAAILTSSRMMGTTGMKDKRETVRWNGLPHRL